MHIDAHCEGCQDTQSKAAVARLRVAADPEVFAEGGCGPQPSRPQPWGGYPVLYMTSLRF